MYSVFEFVWDCGGVSFLINLFIKKVVKYLNITYDCDEIVFIKF